MAVTIKDMEKASTREISRLGLFSLNEISQDMTRRLIEVSCGVHGKSRKE